jgi:hypothetical protein
LDGSFHVGGDSRLEDEKREKDIDKNRGVEGLFVEGAKYAKVDWAGKPDLVADCRLTSDTNTNCSNHDRLRQFQPSGKPLAYADDDQ